MTPNQGQGSNQRGSRWPSLTPSATSKWNTSREAGHVETPALVLHPHLRICLETKRNIREEVKKEDSQSRNADESQNESMSKCTWIDRTEVTRKEYTKNS